MRFSGLTIVAGLLPFGSVALPNNARDYTPYKKLPRSYSQNPIRATNDNSTSQSLERADAVREAFQYAWSGYYKYAFPKDILLPLNNTGENELGGWGASAIDALSTACIMRIPDIVQQITDYVPSIDYSTSTPANETISLFETTIRHLGGLLAGYDLLSGPLADAGLVSDTGAVQSLLDQAKNLADNLKYAFDSPTGIPYNGLFLANKSTDGSTDNGLATVGTLVLEWTHLSDLLNDSSYGELAQKAETYLLNPKPASSEPWPGLLGTNINITTGLFEDAVGGWSGGDDSFYEYLIKAYVYDTSRFEEYKSRWTLAADSSIEHLASHPSSRPDLTFLAEFNGTNLILESEHLTCFDGGNFLLGGQVLNRQDYINFGLALVDGCHATYTETATGIGPEIFSWNTTELPANQTAFYNRAGFWIISGVYILRPEVIESFYYAYRITKDPKYQDWAWEAFVNINSTTRAGSGFSDISNVNMPGGGEKLNAQESFLFAEVLKYSYLIHANDEVWQVNHDGENEWVFNTEAHPIKVAGTPV